MKKKVISLVVLSIFLSSYAVSFASHENCGMIATSSTAIHCGMDKADMSCCGGVTQCVTVTLHPVSSAPINKVEIQKDITIDVLVFDSINFGAIYEFGSLEISSDLSPPDIHHGFQTPLLV